VTQTVRILGIPQVIPTSQEALVILYCLLAQPIQPYLLRAARRLQDKYAMA
jgi:hypothetical protein